MGGIGEGAFDLGARRVTTCVHHARERVSTFDRERELAVALVEPSPERHQLPNPTRALGDQHVDSIHVAQPGTRHERVGLMQLG